MNHRKKFQENLFQINTQNFEASALALFFYQAKYNPIYKKYLELLRFEPEKVTSVEEIPFLPIEFFKYHAIKTGSFEPKRVFESSGTTGQVRSKHYVADLNLYHQLSQYIFEQMYGALSAYHILALLPSYLERSQASLVEMVAHFIAQSKSAEAGFYLDDFEQLSHKLAKLQAQGDRKILLLGVTFGLLDFAENYPMKLSEAIIMETGGMKGRRRELLRTEVHQILKDAFGVAQVHSEYGMTELLSQAYSKADELFETPPWMRIYLRDLRDPLCIDNHLRTGAINVIDLANIDSCAFIATQDIGTWATKDKFKVLGRTDASDMRGCNLMVW